MMLTNELRGAIVAKGYNMSDIARKLNITPKTFYDKMEKGVFKSNELEQMIDILDLEDPMRIFFGK